MRKKYCSIIICLICASGWSQVDTVEVAKGFKTILTFPGNFDFSVNGKEDYFVESFPNDTSSETAKSVVLLSYNYLAEDDVDRTNYTVYTKDGFAYDFLLKLVASPSRKRHSMTRDMADNLSDIQMVTDGAQKVIFSSEKNDPVEVLGPSHQFNGNVIVEENKDLGVSDEKVVSATSKLYELDKREYIRARCYYNQFNKGNVLKLYERNDDIVLWLKGIYFDRDELYFQLRLENKSGIPYDVNFVKTFIGTAYGKRADEQILPFNEEYRYKVPTRVEAGTEDNYFMLVFGKFSLDRHKNLIVELDEQDGSRNITMEIPYILINRAKGFKE